MTAGATLPEKPLFPGYETSPTVVTTIITERMEGMTLPLALDAMASFALVDMSPKLANRRRKLSKPEVQPDARKAAGRHDTAPRPTSLGPSAAEVWGQSLAEWRESNTKTLSVEAMEFVPSTCCNVEGPEAARLDSRTPAFVPGPTVRKPRRRTFPRLTAEVAAEIEAEIEAEL